MNNKDFDISTKHKKRDDLVKNKNENLLKGVGEYWTPFYRENPHRFSLDYLGVSIHPFQQFLVSEINANEQSCVIATRGIGKSWVLGLYACIRAILYPKSSILVACKRKKQAKLLITSKIMGDIYGRSEALRREILTMRNNNNECKIIFKNGSVIEAVVSNDDSRGYRACVLIIDEYRTVDQNICDSVLIPFLNTPRQPAYLQNPKYSNHIEENVEIYLSSGWYSSEWSYQRYQETIKGMKNHENMFACSLPFTVALEHGLTTKKRIKKEMEKESMSPAMFAMEYCGLFYKEEEGAFFKSSMINPCRTLDYAFYPPSKVEYLKYKNAKSKPYKIPKQANEIRIIACDIAISGGKKNDNSIYMCIRLFLDGSENRRDVVCIESYNGKEQEAQAVRIKELFEDFDADYIIIDTNGVGSGVWSYLQKKNYDIDRGKEYEGFTCFNEDNTVDEELKKIGIPVVYSMKTYAQENHQCAISLRDAFLTKSIRLPLATVDARGMIFESKNIKKDEIKEKIYAEGEFLTPYKQTDVMVSEIINLKHKIMDGKIKLYEKSGLRKDRASALLYGNFLCDYFIKEDYKKHHKKKTGYLFLR